LPLTLIEAQANGLQCIVSENITKEIDINGQIEFLSLDDIGKWVDTLNINHTNIDRNINYEGLKLFDINTMKEKLSSIYKLLC
jgi:hypothetical protein